MEVVMQIEVLIYEDHHDTSKGGITYTIYYLAEGSTVRARILPT